MSSRRGGLRRRDLFTVAIAVGCLVYVVLSWVFRRSAELPPVTWPAAIVPVGLAVGLVLAGRRVRATVRGVAKRPVEALAAFRTLRLAQACALGGAATAGGYLAYTALAWPDIDAASVRSAAITALVMAASGAVLALSGLWVESMCRIDPPRDESLDDDADDPYGGHDDHRNHGGHGSHGERY